ncbi:FimV/HubP family polar landmark protein [Burkholderia alba]|uniref:FimV/HubP family polar landmark protein n=1 Tax=Burkholderia alba TaxID=2683677 RepID=UPI002B05EA53|nr:FimV/HubP family polar landmark protein [Burkholderia alba]
MTLRFLSLPGFGVERRALRAIALAAAVLASAAAVSAAHAAPDASAADAAQSAPLTITVSPGQSLNDIAAAATQSRDPGVLARTGRALFEANPQAFMKRDPSRLKIGATLTVPALDATGAAIVHGASGAAAASAAASGPVASAAATVGAASHASAPASHASPVSGAAAVSAASATNASAAAVSAASAAVGQGASSSPLAQPADAVPPAASVNAPAGASGPHVWTGSIQAAPAGASDAAAAALLAGAAHGAPSGSTGTGAADASQARPSSLQQLLALKNRVLMELQKHGIGKPAPDRANVAPTGDAPGGVAKQGTATPAIAGFGADSAALASSASAAAPAPAPQAVPAPAATPKPAAAPAAPFNQGAAIAVGAAVVALILGFVLRRRKKPDAATDAAQAPMSAAPNDAHASVSAQPSPDASVATSVAASESDIPPEPLAAKAHATGGLSLPDALSETPLLPDEVHGVASHASEPAARIGTPPETDTHRASPAEPVVPPATLVWDDEPRTVSDPQPAAHPAAVAPEPAVPPHAAAPSTSAPFAEFPRDAISALDSLDMPLPPRAAADHDDAFASRSRAAEPFSADPAEKATNGPSHPPRPNGSGVVDRTGAHLDDGDQDFAESPIPDHGQGAGQSAPTLDLTRSPAPLGGAQFGALNLDFDLELPAGPSATLPAFTPEALAKIARNKLELASEYVELGDLAGARMLAQEVIDADHAGTRDEARALLAKLADIS